MAEDRALDKQRLMRAMESTRQSIQDTAGELKERIQESADWKHQVRRHPVTSLAVAMAGGLAVAALIMPAISLARFQRSDSSRGGRFALAMGVLSQLGAVPFLVAQVRRLAGLDSASRR
jgi:hypothetical protein